MIIHVAESRYLNDGQFELTFNDGRCGVADLRGTLSGPVFEPLRDPEFLARGTVDPETRTLCWPNGADIAPEYLYFLAFRDDPALSNLFHEWGYVEQHSAAVR
ncbi:MAG TPA: DUF2442 domain-containing protein [Thermoanaerobaculia bacterium]|nr:DUF2442 domain-containing protein [Thermoanaerobaculia bacterium]